MLLFDELSSFSVFLVGIPRTIVLHEKSLHDHHSVGIWVGVVSLSRFFCSTFFTNFLDSTQSELVLPLWYKYKMDTRKSNKQIEEN